MPGSTTWFRYPDTSSGLIVHQQELASKKAASRKSKMKFLIVLIALFAAVAIASPTVAIASSANAPPSADTAVADESAAVKYLLTHPSASHKVAEDGPAPVGCYWDGTSPFCAGSCPFADYPQRDVGLCGDGACCWTGYKTLCCK